MSKIRIFTDGACKGNPGPGGWAAVICLPKKIRELSGYEAVTTNNRMELKAVIESIKFCLSSGYKNLEIYSDSAYVVNAIKYDWLNNWAKNGWIKFDLEEVKNSDLWKELFTIISKNKRIGFNKVKGHSNNIYNNIADGLAKQEYKRALQN